RSATGAGIAVKRVGRCGGTVRQLEEPFRKEDPMTRSIRWTRTIVLAVLVVVGLSAAASMARAAAASGALVTTKAEIALLTTKGVSGTGINVDTEAGNVTLHGKVYTDAEKAKAESTVKGIAGVKSIKNLLQVVPEPRAKAVEAADDQVKDRVAKALKADPAIGASDVRVQSVNNGVVLLGGDVKNMTDHLRAVEIAANVPGVRRVESEIKGPDKLAAATR